MCIRYRASDYDELDESDDYDFEEDEEESESDGEDFMKRAAKLAEAAAEEAVVLAVEKSLDLLVDDAVVVEEI